MSVTDAAAGSGGRRGQYPVQTIELVSRGVRHPRSRRVCERLLHQLLAVFVAESDQGFCASGRKPVFLVSQRRVSALGRLRRKRLKAASS